MVQAAAQAQAVVAAAKSRGDGLVSLVVPNVFMKEIRQILTTVPFFKLLRSQ